MRWFREADEGGDMKARYWLGVALCNGSGGTIEPKRV